MVKECSYFVPGEQNGCSQVAFAQRFFDASQGAAHSANYKSPLVKKKGFELTNRCFFRFPIIAFDPIVQHWQDDQGQKGRAYYSSDDNGR
jgi:hypothetical protein